MDNVDFKLEFKNSKIRIFLKKKLLHFFISKRVLAQIIFAKFFHWWGQAKIKIGT
jgi:hypothetical protein